MCALKHKRAVALSPTQARNAHTHLHGPLHTRIHAHELTPNTATNTHPPAHTHTHTHARTHAHTARALTGTHSHSLTQTRTSEPQRTHTRILVYARTAPSTLDWSCQHRHGRLRADRNAEVPRQRAASGRGAPVPVHIWQGGAQSRCRCAAYQHKPIDATHQRVLREKAKPITTVARRGEARRGSL